MISSLQASPYLKSRSPTLLCRISALLIFSPACALDAPTEQHCPPQSFTNSHRSNAMRELLDLQQMPSICFGPFRPSVIVETGQIWMDQALPVREGAARLSHLLEHQAEPPVVAGTDCLSRALEAEVRALSTELSWRLALKVDHPVWPLAFESQWRETPEDGLIRSYLYEHPEGGGGIAPVLQDYKTRCSSP